MSEWSSRVATWRYVLKIFATEFPARLDIDKAAFAAAAIAWIRGIKKSKVLEQADAKELYDDDVWLETTEGETLSFKTFEQGQTSVFGVRLEIPDERGLRWRTECVYSNFGNEAYLRVRGQCVAIDGAAQVSTPLKPYFITQSINDEWAALDGNFKTASKPHYLRDEDVDIASSILSGSATKFLPSIYVSRGNRNQLPFDAEYLARKLAGMCHVVVEPDRSFSFDLMQQTEGRNPYGGAVGLFSPSGREVGRFFRRAGDNTGSQLAGTCVEQVNHFMSSLAASKAWEWQQLQEGQSRHLREQVAAHSSDHLDEYINAFDAEIQAKNERIENLENLLQLSRHKSLAESAERSDLLPPNLVSKIGPELYEGEFSDRLRAYLTMSVQSDSTQADERTKIFIEKFLGATETSGRANSLISQIKTASKDGKETPKRLGALLLSFGFTKSHDGKHLKFSPPNDFFGLQTEVLPSTPSDSQRGGKNRGQEVIRHFGLNDLRR